MDPLLAYWLSATINPTWPDGSCMFKYSRMFTGCPGKEDCHLTESEGDKKRAFWKCVTRSDGEKYQPCFHLWFATCLSDVLGTQNKKWAVGSEYKPHSGELRPTGLWTRAGAFAKPSCGSTPWVATLFQMIAYMASLKGSRDMCLFFYLFCCKVGLSSQEEADRRGNV